MEYIVYDKLPAEAVQIRQTVFVEEQGFLEEFDQTDNHASHIVAYHNAKPVATCRFFHDPQQDAYIIGRIAVLKPYRGQHLGAKLMEQAETQIISCHGKQILLHAQQQAVPFYEKLGYQTFGGIGYEEWCPHVWMRKELP